MTYQISWYLEKRIVVLTTEAVLALDELPGLFEGIQQFRDDGNYPVHIISDFSRLEKFPVSLAAIRQVTPAMRGFGVNVIIGVRNPVLHFLLNAFSQFSSLEIRVSEDLSEALHVLARLDPSLSHLAD